MSRSLWSRLRKSRIIQVLLAYLVASWIVLQVARELQEALSLPEWVAPVALILLLVGLVIILATAWVQSHPLVEEHEEGSNVPGSWELALGDLAQSVRRGRLPHLTWSRSILGGIVAFSILFGIAGLYVVIQDRGRSFAPAELVADEPAAGIAVLPFSVNAPELQVWREGMVDILSTNLDGAAGLRAIDSRTVLARWRESVPDGATPDLASILQVARETGARWALVGSAAAVGPDVRLTAEVYDVETGAELGQAWEEGAADSVLVLTNRLSIAVMRTILAEAGASLPPMQHVASLTTTSLPALRSYLEGESRFRRSNFVGAIEAYEEAVARDSTFALALARLALAFGWAEGIGTRKANEYRDRALRHIDQLPSREALVLRGGSALAQGSSSGLETLRLAVQRYPDDPEAWHLLGDLYVHHGDELMVEPSEVDRALERAIELDPSFGPYYIHTVERAINRRDSAAAARLLEAQGRAAPDSRFHRGHALGFRLVFGDSATRAAAIAALDTTTYSTLSALRFGFGAPATAAEKEVVIREILRRPEANVIERVWFTYALIWRGKVAEALQILEDPEIQQQVRITLRGALHADGLIDGPIIPEDEDLPDDATFVELPIEARLGIAFLRGLDAAERGRWGEQADWARRARQMGELARTEGDTLGVRIARGVEQALQGLRLWRRGETAQALSSLREARRRTVDWGTPNDMIRRWIPEILIELDRPEDAIAYLESHGGAHWTSPHASTALYLLGTVHERLGRVEAAREAYRAFLHAWADADPGLDWKQQAEEALQRLEPLASATR